MIPLPGQVRIEGLEPTRLSAPDPKSGAATDYAISADKSECKSTIFSFRCKFNKNFLQIFVEER